MASDPVLVREERSPASALLPAVAAGLVAAVVGGVVWGLIVKWTDYEVGFAAWGIGFLVGLAVVTAARTRGLVLQVVAVLCALLGILIGKYLSFVWVLQKRRKTSSARRSTSRCSRWTPSISSGTTSTPSSAGSTCSGSGSPWSAPGAPSSPRDRRPQNQSPRLRLTSPDLS